MGSWYSLLDLKLMIEPFAEEDRQYFRSFCPNDGGPYQTGPHGELYCPFDGYRPDSH